MTATPQIRTLLVANRGEIARRVLRTCRALGIATVAVHSDADADAPHAAEADAAVRLPGDAPQDTYLRGDLLVAAARAAGADAVHPGYGFLSEDAGFARAVTEAGLVWVGPPPAAIEAMASKTRAKELMRAAGVPLLEPLDTGRVTGADLPLIVKAAAGGGGRGMRVVRSLDALPDALTAARAEAAAAFGDGEVFAESYVERGRHVEVQVLADGHGTVWALGTRDCSLQRRHQKVIEEAPAPRLDDATRAALHDAARQAARAVDYRGAGTVEFLLPAGGRPCFLEMNTRLQVEHPVTEAVYGVDLVALQIRVAEGGRLDAEPPRPRGHAVEARLYAEDPARDWQPQTGTLHRLALPGAGPDGAGPDAVGDGVVRRGGAHGVRLDSGVRDGGVVTAHYDPMLAKVIAWAPDRAGAVRLLAHTLERARVHGPVTNRALLVRSLRHPDFAAARLDTGFYDRHLPALTAPGEDSGAALAALAAALADAVGRSRFGGWRNVPSAPQTKTYRARPCGTAHEIRYRTDRTGLRAEAFPGVRLLHAARDRVVLEAGGVRRTFDVAAYPDGTVHVDSPLGAHAFTALPRFPEPGTRTVPGSLLAPMPGTVVRIADGLTAGAPVTEGQPLLWLEAMKMEHRVTAPATGTLTALHAEPGRQVAVGALLAVVSPGPDTATAPEPAPEPVPGPDSATAPGPRTGTRQLTEASEEEPA
ncbi:biotin carboxylase N-terminal domain-containing protein [Streptomyces sp. TRM 70351]|uniref:acetyl/propionyl/methylcrotonyl-CoA carboxylase subunit alpha n=1 Tax=Streptomyces sp. TRM 70351 TaxID=3116552 RepID=UPI002E7AB98E|nr:biotin carboxylase N-terminal domain-containing protein [Streptomyces sp. TRM 70351]MEE1929592.1 biotin carboxylase N-terminal domain-containing protein [Streptomyces sp. TRM 70351]